LPSADVERASLRGGAIRKRVTPQKQRTTARRRRERETKEKGASTKHLFSYGAVFISSPQQDSTLEGENESEWSLSCRAAFLPFAFVTSNVNKTANWQLYNLEDWQQEC
jgi:hypothetical protein